MAGRDDEQAPHRRAEDDRAQMKDNKAICAMLRELVANDDAVERNDLRELSRPSHGGAGRESSWQ